MGILIDDLHFEFKMTPSARQMIRVISGTLVRQGDEFAVRSAGYSQIHEGVTSDLTRLADVISKVQGSGLSEADIQRGGSSAIDEVKARTAATSATTLEFLDQLRTSPGRRKVLVFISSAPIAPALMRSSNRADVTIYAVDPRQFAQKRNEFDALLSRIDAEIR